MGFNARRLPASWDTASEDFEYVPVKLPPDVTRVGAALRLQLQAEFGGWELSRVRRYPDGTRGVLLKRRKSARHVPEPDVS
ncbi:hypothetical protein DW322_14700 [Rhodococcus rhodnii]|uniref:Dihydroorotate dehydrogenase n=2 Tax=Rhodococcus rhodnii TaxID=38312 RepID=R7WWA0_9NOCA|nr:DUF5703 family protein [Rhodococcus rhodnii]EOM78419.1 hypothetical protein Rrhod_0248 [Rhodococcus rhodnii LMG 5362]TXG91236.1 hypothetical protein DW322_14700 [Rhodococcus rhodnii]